MEENLNGMIVRGKIYVATESNDDKPCDNCDLRELCDDYDITDVCTRLYGLNANFQFSQTLTDKLNGNENN